MKYTKILRLLALVVTLSFVAMLIPASPALAAEDIEISPENGEVGDKIEITGENLSVAQIGVDIYFSSQEADVGDNIDDEVDLYKRVKTRTINEDGEIDWGLSAEQLWRQIRAFQPWPGSFTWYQGRRLKILEALPLPGEGGESGRAVPLNDALSPAGVVTGDGLLALRWVQLEGKRPLDIAEFLRGQRQFLGSRLPWR